MVSALLFSFVKSRQKTKIALKKAWKSFENIMPQFLTVILLIGLMLTVLDKETIGKVLGSQSGVLGMAIAAILGSITLIPGFVAFPLAASVLSAGAGYGQVAMFVSTLMMVGVVTLSVEFKYFGKTAAIYRNLLALGFSIICAVVIGGILG
jgi:uncharacterized membrane protein YraQ (UPF0718 family)